jgi:hypothetical protein
MYSLGNSLDNLSLMGLTIAVGFLVCPVFPGYADDLFKFASHLAVLRFRLARLLQPMSVGNLLRPIATDPHAAPSTRTASRAIGKHQRAGCSLTCFHVREVFLGEHPRQCFANRKEERFRRSPASGTLKRKRSSLPIPMRH